MPKPNPNQILEITHGSWKTQVLYAAVSLGPFTMISEGIDTAKEMAGKIDLSGRKKLLDIGGGSGAYSITLTQKYPDLHAVIYELPNVAKVAEGYIKEAHANRVKTMDGDFHTDDLPAGYDTALISQILHSYSPETCRTIIAKAYNTLSDGGLLIINEFLLDDDKAGPEYAALFSLNMLLESRGKGSSYTFAEISNWLTEAGFKNIEKVSLAGPHVAIAAEK